MVMMMTTTALTAVATPHALVLTVSHDLLFRQPPFAAALMPPFLFIGLLVLTMRHSCCRLTAAGKCIRLIFNVTSAIAALTLGLTAVLQTPVMRATAPYKCAPTDERLGMNGGDPVCRLFRLSLSGFRSLLGLRCQPLGAELLKSLLRAFEAARRHHLGPIPWPQASRFRPIFQVLFCRGQSAFLPGSNASRSCPFPCNEGAWRPIKVGLRR
jgi:hypothetical protein